VPSSPGWSVAVQANFYNGGEDEATYLNGDRLSDGQRSKELTLNVQPGYSPKTKLWGGQMFFGLGFGVAAADSSADSSVSTRTGFTEQDHSDSKSGGTDLYPFASLAWARGVHNWMTYVTGDIPVGAYDSARLANIGIGHAAIDAGAAYTYFDEKTGWGFSTLLGFTYNWENPSTDYKNGIDSHVEFTLSRFVTPKWHLGAVSYLYDQLTADRYPTEGASGAVKSDALGSFESRVASIGAAVGYMFTVKGQPTYASLRGYWEFWAENRLQGYSVFAAITFTLGH
jgi:hypothetical protein